MAAKATLFDRVKHAMVTGGSLGYYHPTGELSWDLKRIFIKAYPFVIDDAALRTAIELRNGMLNSRKYYLPDIAPVPHEYTWIEYDPAIKVPEFDPFLTDAKVGHMLITTSQGFSTMTFGQSRTDPDDITVLPVIVNVGNPNVICNWRHKIGDDFGKQFSPRTSAWLTNMLILGHDDYAPKLPWADRIGGDIVQPNVPRQKVPELAEEIIHYIHQERASISLLMGLLSLIAWCPVEKVPTRPQGMWLHKRKPRPYIDYTTIRVKIPIRKVYEYVEKAYAREVQRRRRHMCRQHIRVYHKGKPNEFIKIIAEHPRGDASLGWVHQRYEVSTHESRKRRPRGQTDGE